VARTPSRTVTLSDGTASLGRAPFDGTGKATISVSSPAVAVDRVELDLRHVRRRLHAGAREMRAVDAGGDHHLTLVRFEELPCIGNRLPIIPDVVEEIEHDLVDARANQRGAVGVAPLADAERAAARTPAPSPTKARREAIHSPQQKPVASSLLRYPPVRLLCC
jgi:hypothetical protein